MTEFIFWIAALCGTATCKLDPVARPPTISVCVLEKARIEKMRAVNLQDKEGKIALQVVPTFCLLA